MIRDTSESDYTSIVPSTSSSPAAAAYYIQSPCTDSHDEADKCSPYYNSFLRTSTHSVTTDSSRVSGPRCKWNDRKRGYFEVVDEEKCYGDDGTEYHRGSSSLLRSFVVLLSFGVIFTAFCLVYWAASRPYSVRVKVQVHNSLLIAQPHYHPCSIPS